MKTITKPVSVLLSLLLLLSVLASAPFTVGAAETSGTTGDCVWTYDPSEKTLTVGGSGRMADYGWMPMEEQTTAPWGGYEIAHIVIGGGVTYVGAYAFPALRSLQTLTAGGSVKEIGEYAFMRTALTGVRLPDSVETIGDNAFADSTGLTTLELGSGVKTIGEGAFADCALRELTIPDSTEVIGDAAFYYNKSLTMLTLGKNVRVIGGSAFDCCALTGVTLPDSVETVDAYAFAENSGLNTVIAGKNIKTIGQEAFGFTADPETGRSVPIEGFTVCGWKNTAAETYAAANSLCFVDLDTAVFDLWLGSRQVTGNNMGDIFGDGSAAFDPGAGLLTLRDPDIGGVHEGCGIYSGAALTVRGSCRVTGAEIGVHSENTLTLDGDLAFTGTRHAVSARDALVIAGGTLTAVSETADAILSTNGSVTLCDGVVRVEAQSGSCAVSGVGLILGDRLRITAPDGGHVGDDPVFWGFQTILDQNENVATAAVIEDPDAVLAGDVNGDGTVDITDATYVQMAIAGIVTLSAARQKAADTNSDGAIDITDATYIQMYLAHIITHLG